MDGALDFARFWRVVGFGMKLAHVLQYHLDMTATWGCRGNYGDGTMKTIYISLDMLGDAEETTDIDLFLRQLDKRLPDYNFELDDNASVENARNDIDTDGIVTQSIWNAALDNARTVEVSGQRVLFENAVHLMDDEIREELHAERFNSAQAFVDAYIKAHAEKFAGEEFIVS